MKKLIIALLLVLMSNQALAGVKGSVGYEFQQSTTTQTIPYTVCTPVCQTTNSTSEFQMSNNGLRLNLGYEQHIAGPVSLDVMFGTTPTFFDQRYEANALYAVNDNLKVKAGVNRYTEKNDSTFSYKPGTGFQAGVEYKLPGQGEVSPFVDVKYYRMNTSYDVSGSNSINDKKIDAVSIGIGLSF